MLFELKKSRTIEVGKELVQKDAAELGLMEKTIEDWIAENPSILFPKEKVLVFAQSISGKSMADVLALDAVGNLIVIEVKRDWSDRSTVGQLMEYAAGMLSPSYERLNALAKQYSKWQGDELYDKFLAIADDESFPKELIGHKQRVVIVAPDSDQSLQGIVLWLRNYGVPIEFVSFSVFAENGEPRILRIDGVQGSPELPRSTESWAGHWIFNTNESNFPGAYIKMFAANVAAIEGYPNGGGNLEGASSGQLVFAYVNNVGLAALGRVKTGHVKPGQGIFVDNGTPSASEFHLEVEWEVVLPAINAITTKESRALVDYSLPVRTVFGKLSRGRSATILEQEIRRRSG